MPERLKVRAAIAAELLGHPDPFLSGHHDAPPGEQESTHLLALRIADQAYRLVTNQDLGRTLTVANATHHHQCLAPDDSRDAWTGKDTCPWCLQAALLDCSELNRSRSVQDARDNPSPLTSSVPHDELWLERTQRHAERQEQHDHPTTPGLTGGQAEALTLHRYAQRSGACVILWGPDQPGALIQLKVGASFSRHEIIDGLSAAIRSAQAQLNTLLEP